MPIETFLKIKERYDYCYLLESIEGQDRLARFSFIGFMPKLILIAKKNFSILQNMEDGNFIEIKVKDPLHIMKELLGKKIEDDGFRFLGGFVGYISYDSIHYWEKIKSKSIDDLKFPDIQMGLYEDGIIFDHLSGENFYFFRGEDRSDELKIIEKENIPLGNFSFSEPKTNILKDYYEELVDRAKSYITSGDIFQVVLSKRYNFEIKGDLIKFYLALRRINPSPYMYFLKMGERKIIGSSPEMLARVDGRMIETFPIAGTRPRLENRVKNEALTRNLLSDPKEIAEHVMLVDLARNDIGKISKFGSVHVPEFMEVHQYSHVQHIVSRVVGELKDNSDSYDALRAVFPAGTVSGAPKVRAMEIIGELETTSRGPYAGAVGYFSFNGNSDFAITIRTLIADGNHCFIQAGGGIVADSVPETEWFETEHKVGALKKALEISEE